MGLDDLRSIDPELHRHVGWLDRYQDVGSLDLDFCVGSHELVEGGANVVVTNENKHEYLSLVLRWHLLGSIESQLWHLLRGLYTVVPPDVLRAFDHAELEFLFTGTQVRGRLAVGWLGRRLGGTRKVCSHCRPTRTWALGP